jgi:hypothetical protein
MNTEPLTPSDSKFYNCKFRSETPITKIIKRCSCRGGNYSLTGYYCNKLEIFELSEEFCQNCETYEPK